MFPPIPQREAPAAECTAAPRASSFFCITPGDRLDVKMQYPLRGHKTAVEQCYVRHEVYEMLQQAASYLPPGFRIRLWDAWRPLALQQELFDALSRQITERFDLARLDEAQRLAVISQYVSLPSDNRQNPPLHTTGGAVDVTLLDAAGNELDMGTPFDSFTPDSATAYFESHPCSGHIRQNRRLLYYCMTRAGFENLPSEWWHYDYGDRAWAYYRGLPALYTGIFDLKEITSHETQS